MAIELEKVVAELYPEHPFTITGKFELEKVNWQKGVPPNFLWKDVLARQAEIEAIQQDEQTYKALSRLQFLIMLEHTFNITQENVLETFQQEFVEKKTFVIAKNEFLLQQEFTRRGREVANIQQAFLLTDAALDTAWLEALEY